MKRLILAVLVGLTFATTGFSEAKKAKKDKKEAKKEDTSAPKESDEPKTKPKAVKTANDTVAPSPAAAQNILLFDAERGKTRGKLVLHIEKSADFEKTPKLLGRYQVRSTPRTEEAEKKPAESPKQPVTPTDKPKTEPAKTNEKETPVKAPEKAAKENPSEDEDSEN